MNGLSREPTHEAGGSLTGCAAADRFLDWFAAIGSGGPNPFRASPTYCNDPWVDLLRPFAGEVRQ